MEPQKKSSKVLNIVLFLVMLAFLVFFIYSMFGSAFSNEDPSSFSQEVQVIGLVIALLGALVSYFGINRASGGTVLRGITVGFIIGSAVLTIIVVIMSVL